MRFFAQTSVQRNKLFLVVTKVFFQSILCISVVARTSRIQSRMSSSESAEAQPVSASVKNTSNSHSFGVCKRTCKSLTGLKNHQRTCKSFLQVDVATGVDKSIVISKL